MQKREKVFGAITLAAGVFFVVNQFICAGEQETLSPDQVDASSWEQDEVQPASIVAGEQISNEDLKKRLQNWQPLVSYENWGRNPFEGARKLEQADSSADSLVFKLAGIVEKGAEKFALIDDYIVQKGDRTAEFEVVKVSADRVVVRYAGKLVTLYLNKQKAKANVKIGAGK